jgi:hypothetical protein
MTSHTSRISDWCRANVRDIASLTSLAVNSALRANVSLGRPGIYVGYIGTASLGLPVKNANSRQSLLICWMSNDVRLRPGESEDIM